MQEKLSTQAYFIYEKDIEYLLASMELLSSFRVNPKIREVYDDAFVEQQKTEYPLLFELFSSIRKEYSTEIMEFMMGYDISDFSLEKYFSYMKGLSKEEFLSVFLQESVEVIRKALSSEQEQIAFYQKHKEGIQGYFAVEILFQKTGWFIDTYYRFVSGLRTKEAEEYLIKHEKVILNWKERIVKGLETEEPLQYSESIMGKTFRNRGPFQTFYFMPSIFMPMMCCRWFESDQILMFDAIRWDQRDNGQISDALKMMSDKTRYKILVLLKERKSMNGIEIAESMNLATSTVSHHMSQLKSSGLIHEEPVGNTKYYSINQHSMKNCIETLEKTFL